MMDKDEIKQLVEDLRLLLTQKRWTQEEGSRRLGVPLITLNRWLNGRAYPKSAITVKALESFVRRNRKGVV